MIELIFLLTTLHSHGQTTDLVELYLATYRLQQPPPLAAKGAFGFADPFDVRIEEAGIHINLVS
jgi:hypothetical protein